MIYGNSQLDTSKITIQHGI